MSKHQSSKTSKNKMQVRNDHPKTVIKNSTTDGNALAVEKLLDDILQEAIRLRASDIHIEPFEKEVAVRYRVDGSLKEGDVKVYPDLGESLMNRIKTVSGMNVAERRVPQNGRIAVTVEDRPFEFRINVVPSAFGETAVMRILDRSGADLTLDQLGFLADTKQKFMKSLNKPFGLVLIAGPTGSGKAFTLMATIAAVRSPGKKIITIENPIEYTLKGVVQVQVNPDVTLSNGSKYDFVSGVHSILLQDPDVIMMGEIRDADMADAACDAAKTAHLVLSTIHCANATSVIPLLIDMGVKPYQLRPTLECVLAQKLIRTLCKTCKKPEPKPSRDLLKRLDELNIDRKKANFMRPVGCARCGNKGLKGRTAIHELLVMNDEIRNLCEKGVTDSEIRNAAVKNGLRTFLVDGLVKVCQGITTLEEVLLSTK